MSKETEFDPESASDAERLREAARWFDSVDKLLSVINVEKSDGSVHWLMEDTKPDRAIQEDLIRIAERLEAIDGGW